MPTPFSQVSPPIRVDIGTTVGPPGPSVGGSGGVPAGTDMSMSLPGADTGQQNILGVEISPGWTVVGAFQYDEADHAVIAPGLLERKFHATVLASSSLLQVRVKLVRADTLIDVPGSLLTFVAPVNIETTLDTGDISSNLTTGAKYQVQAECTGGGASSDFATVRSAGMRAAYSY